MTGGLVEVYVRRVEERRRQALLPPVKTENEQEGFLKTTVSTLKLFWDLEPQNSKVKIVLTENKVLQKKKKKRQMHILAKGFIFEFRLKINLFLRPNKKAISGKKNGQKVWFSDYLKNL